MKIKLRLPTADQYAFTEIELEEKNGKVYSPEDVHALYSAYMSAFKSSEGMSEVEMDKWVENMMLRNGNNPDVYAKATPAQKVELHRIKRALGRIKNKQEEPEIE